MTCFFWKAFADTATDFYFPIESEIERPPLAADCMNDHHPGPSQQPYCSEETELSMTTNEPQSQAWSLMAY